MSIQTACASTFGHLFTPLKINMRSLPNIIFHNACVSWLHTKCINSEVDNINTVNYKLIPRAQLKCSHTNNYESITIFATCKDHVYPVQRTLSELLPAVRYRRVAVIMDQRPVSTRDRFEWRFISVFNHSYGWNCPGHDKTNNNRTVEDNYRVKHLMVHTCLDKY